MNLIDVVVLGALGFVVWRVTGGHPLSAPNGAPQQAPQPTPAAPLTQAQATNALQITGASWCAVDASTQLWHAHAQINHQGRGSDGGIFAVYLVGAWAAASFLGQTIMQGDRQTVAQQDLSVGPDPEWASYELDLRGPGPSGATATPIARLVIQDLDGNEYDARDVPTHWGSD